MVTRCTDRSVHALFANSTATTGRWIFSSSLAVISCRNSHENVYLEELFKISSLYSVNIC
jgi:hypothetical protein